MPVSVRSFLCTACASLALASEAIAGTTGVYLPPAPTGPGGEDSIETSSGTRCRQSMNSNNGYVDMGLTGSAASPDRYDDGPSYGYSDIRNQQGMAYVRVTIPLGHRPKRFDCSKIYALEVQKLQREVELLKLGVDK